MGMRFRLMAGAVVVVLGAGATTLVAGAIGEAPKPEELMADAREKAAALEAKLTTLESLHPDLAAARAQVDELRNALSQKDQSIARLESLSGQLETLAGQNTLAVLGRGSVSAQPDILYATYTVWIQRPTLREAWDTAHAVAKKVTEDLKGQGVKPADLSTQGISAGPHWNWETHKQEGFFTQNSILAKIRDVSRAGTILSAPLENTNGDVRFGGAHFSLEGSPALMKLAREDAVKDARTKAGEYAGFAGRKVGRILFISEPLPQTWQSSPNVLASRSGGLAPLAMSPATLEPGEQSIGVRVIVVFALD